MQLLVQVREFSLWKVLKSIRFKGGTTIYGLEMMEKAGVRAALMETITSATNRAAQLES
jgi:pyrroline-5-carboxylate reductase